MKRYVQVGCGHRGIEAYAVPLVKEYGAYGELCGVYDVNPRRAALVSEFCGTPIPTYDSFSRMLDEVKPDTVIVTTVDCYHDGYIIAALEAGCDVICEKPVTTTLEKAQAIYEAQRKSGKKVTVTFNLRFHPFFSKLKEIVSTGELGEILSVHYEWMLGMTHGADYFRRWHSRREKSGSLLIHKSTHHFDIVNWLLEQTPVSVNAYGTRRVFGDAGQAKATRCLICGDRCSYYYDILGNDIHKRLYYDCEGEDGYLRDRCVFDPRIDIEDTVSVNVRYSGGAVMSYTLSASSPYEGMRLVLNGTKGRLEATNVDNTLRLYRAGGETTLLELGPEEDDAHGGADRRIRDHLFMGTPINLPGQEAGLREGFMSIAIGAAANRSMAEERRVELTAYANTLFK